jgi:ribosomal protein S18 acetylase RimI-like enzyme
MATLQLPPGDLRRWTSRRIIGIMRHSRPEVAMDTSRDQSKLRARLTTRSGRTVTVRPLGAGDAPLLQRFNAGLSERTRELFSPHAYDDATLAKAIDRAETDQDRVYLALDSADGAVAGYCFLWYMEEPVPVLGIGLADAYQGQGLGRQLMGILVEDARAAGKDGIELTTMLTNDRAFHLYRTVGFQYLGDVDNLTGDGRAVRERHMFLPLREGAAPSPREHGPPV